MTDSKTSITRCEYTLTDIPQVIISQVTNTTHEYRNLGRNATKYNTYRFKDGGTSACIVSEEKTFVIDQSKHDRIGLNTNSTFAELWSI